MVTAFVKQNDKVVREDDLKKIQLRGSENLLWIDLYSPSEEEQKSVEALMEVSLQTRQQLQEIESSSRYFETENLIIANSNFFKIAQDEFIEEPISFILKEHTLVSLRHFDSRSFNETIKKLETRPKSYPTAYHIFVALFETRIDLDADLLEAISKDISLISKSLTVNKKLSEKTIISITEYQEKTLKIRENIIDKQRVISGILKSEQFPKDTNQKLRVMIKDISSLLDYTVFYFNRLEYLQNSFLGLINLEQNKIIKFFTVASVMFMPPTLIASIYGMNFPAMPEMSWTHGYAYAIFAIFFSAFLTWGIFKIKKWM